MVVYRTDDYKRLKTIVDKQSKRSMPMLSWCRSAFVMVICPAVERRKEHLGEAKAVAGKKKLDKQEEQLRAHSRDLNMVKMKSVLVIGFTFTALLGMFNTM